MYLKGMASYVHKQETLHTKLEILIWYRSDKPYWFLWLFIFLIDLCILDVFLLSYSLSNQWLEMMLMELGMVQSLRLSQDLKLVGGSIHMIYLQGITRDLSSPNPALWP